MNFYSTIAAHYEDIFPYNASQLHFISTQAPKNKHPKLIEIGAARGVLTQACSQEGYLAKGLELDNTMVAMAQINYSKTPFYSANMLDIEKLFPINSCDVMVCFGNTLVHLSSTDQISSFLTSAYKTLNQGGKLLIQFINYDRIIDQEIKALPTISNEDITFVRDYELVSDTQLHFKGTLTVHADRMSTQNTQTLFPLRRKTFETLAKDVGFTTQAFSNFKSEPWDKNLMQSIFSCTK